MCLPWIRIPFFNRLVAWRESPKCMKSGGKNSERLWTKSSLLLRIMSHKFAQKSKSFLSVGCRWTFFKSNMYSFFLFFPTFWVLREDGEWREGQSKWCTEKCLFNCGKKKIRRQIWKQLTLGKWSFNLRNIFQLNFILYQDMVKCDYNTSLQIIPSITATAVKVCLSIFWKWH